MNTQFRSFTCCLGAIIFMTMYTLSVQAQPFTDRVPNNDNYQEYPRWLYPTKINASNMCVQEDGTVHAVLRGWNGSSEFIQYSNNRLETRSANGFSQPYTIVTKTGSTYIYDLSIAVTRDGKIAISYTTGTNSILSIALTRFLPGTGWMPEEPVATGAIGALFDQNFRGASLAFDDLGELHILYNEIYLTYQLDANGNRIHVNTDTWIHYKKNNQLSTLRDVEHVVGLDQDLSQPIAGASRPGMAQCVWVRYNLTAGTSEIYFGHQNNPAWISQNISGTLSYWTKPDFKVDADGNGHIAWTDRTNGNKLMYVKKIPGATFSTEVINLPPGSIYQSVLTVDERRLPSVAAINFGTTNAKLQFYSKVNNSLPTTNNWATQDELGVVGRELVGSASTLARSPMKIQSSIGNEFHHVLCDSSQYLRSLEPWLSGAGGGMESSFGANTTVNALSGNLHSEIPLFRSSGGYGFSSAVTLIYNSFDGSVGDISQGWSHNYNVYVIDHNPADPFSPVSIHQGDSRIITYHYDPSYGYFRAPDESGEYSRVAKGAGSYTLTTKYGIVYSFETNGRLATITDRNGNTLQCIYGSNPTPSINVNPAENVQPRVLLEIRDSQYPKRPSAKFGYDSRNRLIKVTDPNLVTYTLSYETPTAGLDPRYGKFSAVKFDGAPAGKTVQWKFEYYTNTIAPPATPKDHKNLLAKIYTPRGSKNNYFYEFSYMADGRAYKMTEPSVESVVDDANIDATPVQTQAEKKVIYFDPAPPFDSPGSPGTNAPRANITDRRGKTSSITYQYKRCLADKISDANQNVFKNMYDGQYRNLVRTVDQRGSIQDYFYHTIATPPHVKDNLNKIFRPDGDAPSATALPPIIMEYTTDSYNNIKKSTDSRGNSTSYLYDAKGNVTRVDSPPVHLADGTLQQAFSENTYDSKGRTLTTKDEEGFITSVQYNDPFTGLATSVQRPSVEGTDEYTYNVTGTTKTSKAAGLGVTAYEYTGLNQLSKLTEPTTAAGTPSSSYLYDEDGNTISATDPMSNTSTSIIDRLGRITESRNAKQHRVKSFFDRNGAVRLTIDPNSADGVYDTKSLYDAVGQVKQTKVRITNPDDSQSPNWSISENEYYEDGLVKTSKIVNTDNTKSQTTKYEYNARGLTTRITYPITNIVEDYCYDENDNNTRRISRDLGKTPSFQSGSSSTYDERNRIKTTSAILSDPGQNFCNPNANFVMVTSQTLPDKRGIAKKVIDPDGKKSSQLVDGSGRTTDAIDGDDVTIRKNVYKESEKSVETQSLQPGVSPVMGTVVKSYYNNAGQVIRIVDALGNESRDEYDLNGNHVRSINAKGVVTHSYYNELNQLIKEVSDEGGLNITFLYTYDKNGNVTLITDPRGFTYQNSFDMADRKIKTTYPDGSTETYKYDENGRMIGSKDRAGVIVTYNYDNNSRLTSIQYGAPFAKAITYSDYTNFGAPKKTDDGYVRIENDYDLQGRKIKSTWYIGGTLFNSVSYQYTAASLRKKFTDANGKVTDYTYDNNNRLANIKWDGQQYASFSYYPGGPIKETILAQAQNTKVQRAYNKRLELLSTKTLSPSGGTISSYSYDYDEIGNRSAQHIDHLNGVVRYTYDNISRLTGERWYGCGIPHYMGLYSYDAGGNRLRKETNKSLSTYQYNNVNELMGEQKQSVDNEILLSPVAVTASSAHAPYDAFNVIDGKLDQAITPSAAWRSEKSPEAHTLTLDLGADKQIAKLRLYFPTEFNAPGKFKVQVSSDNVQYTDIQNAEVFGANVPDDQSAWWSACEHVVTFTFIPLQGRYVRYVQAPDGGGGSDIDIAWMNEIEVYSGAYTTTPITYLYDANGNCKERIESTNIDQYFYDHANRMTGYKFFDNITLKTNYSYAYTPTGALRVRKTNELASPKENDLFMYDGTDICNDYKQMGTGAIQLTTSYQQELSIDSKIGVFSHADNKFKFNIRDAIGTNRNMLNDNCKAENERFTSAWGEAITPINNSGAYGARYGFTQRENDGENGLMQFRARGYDPETARFNGVDEENPIGDHYAYAGGNPLSYTDPSGRNWFTEGLAALKDLATTGEVYASPDVAQAASTAFNSTTEGAFLGGLSDATAGMVSSTIDNFHDGYIGARGIWDPRSFNARDLRGGLSQMVVSDVQNSGLGFALYHGSLESVAGMTGFGSILDSWENFKAYDNGKISWSEYKCRSARQVGQGIGTLVTMKAMQEARTLEYQIRLAGQIEPLTVTNGKPSGGTVKWADLRVLASELADQGGGIGGRTGQAKLTWSKWFKNLWRNAQADETVGTYAKPTGGGGKIAAGNDLDLWVRKAMSFAQRAARGDVLRGKLSVPDLIDPVHTLLGSIYYNALGAGKHLLTYEVFRQGLNVIKEGTSEFTTGRSARPYVPKWYSNPWLYITHD